MTAVTEQNALRAAKPFLMAWADTVKADVKRQNPFLNEQSSGLESESRRMSGEEWDSATTDTKAKF